MIPLTWQKTPAGSRGNEEEKHCDTGHQENEDPDVGNVYPFVCRDGAPAAFPGPAGVLYRAVLRAEMDHDRPVPDRPERDSPGKDVEKEALLVPGGVLRLSVHPAAA